MIQYITLNDDKTEAFRESYPKRSRPLKGFYRLKNGNFIKHLSNPMCLSDADARELIRYNKELEERKKNYIAQKDQKPPTGHVATYLDDYDAGSEYSNARMIVQSGRMVKLSHILDCFINYGIFDHKGDAVLYDAVRIKNCDMSALNSRASFAKIVLRRRSKSLLAWHEEKNKLTPDLAIVSGIIWDEETCRLTGI